MTFFATGGQCIKPKAELCSFEAGFEEWTARNEIGSHLDCSFPFVSVDGLGKKLLLELDANSADVQHGLLAA